MIFFKKNYLFSKVITEPELVTEARTLQEVIAAGGAEGAAALLTDYCHRKGDQSLDQHDRYIWHFLKASFDLNPRAEMLNLLGQSVCTIFSIMNVFLYIYV